MRQIASMASRSSSTSEGKVTDPKHKANTFSQPGESAINGSSRVSGRDGASDRHGMAFSAHYVVL